MAEYYLTYGDMYNFIEQYANEKDKLVAEHKAEILAAITCDLERNDTSAVSEFITLWDNQLFQPSELLLGTRYIRVHETAILFIELALTTGFFEGLISTISRESFDINPSISIVLTIHKLISSICKLDDWDFCIYMQAVTHFRAHKKFSKAELLDWFSADQQAERTCNMHTSKWNCSYLQENDMCTILKENQIDSALESLCLKGILQKSNKQGEYSYKFEY